MFVYFTKQTDKQAGFIYLHIKLSLNGNISPILYYRKAKKQLRRVAPTRSSNLRQRLNSQFDVSVLIYYFSHRALLIAPIAMCMEVSLGNSKALALCLYLTQNGRISCTAIVIKTKILHILQCSARTGMPSLANHVSVFIKVNLSVYPYCVPMLFISISIVMPLTMVIKNITSVEGEWREEGGRKQLTWGGLLQGNRRPPPVGP